MIQSVDRALAILELFKDVDSLGLTEIAKKMGIAKSTAFGLVSTLMSKGFLEKDSVTNKYRLGVILLELGGLYSSRLDIRNEALPFMHGLREKTNETVQLSILVGTDIVYIDRAEAPSFIRFTTRVGSMSPAHCTATGKVLLSYIEEEELDRLYKGKSLTAFTDKTITDISSLKQTLKEVKDAGYSIDDEESELGLRGVAAPIFNHKGKVVAALSVGGPTDRVTLDSLLGITEHVCEIGYSISQRLGYRKPPK